MSSKIPLAPGPVACSYSGHVGPRFRAVPINLCRSHTPAGTGRLRGDARWSLWL